MKHSTPPGVYDIVPQNEKEPWKSSFLWQYIENLIRKIANCYGYQEIRTPLFEKTELFERSVGDSSDIVSKEMYSFEDRGGRKLSLRPEGTASVMRAFIEEHMHQKKNIHKFFYIGPMFRYERSQAGRYRQHHQFGAEAIGDGSAEQDVEIIDFLSCLYKGLGLKNLTLYINSIGNKESRELFRSALKAYLEPYRSSLSADSQRRLDINPLRILDSKDSKDKAIVAEAPSILDFLQKEDFEHFEKVKQLLSSLNIPFEINPLLVRGLDYYNKTVFEITAGELGAQNSIGGGGRYDGLISDLGGPPLPSIGFGTGLERILQTAINQGVQLPHAPSPTLFLMAIGERAKEECFKLLHKLRENKISSQMDFGNRKVSKQFELANQARAQFALVIGEEELESQLVELKEMATGHKKTILLSELITAMQQL